MGSPLLKQYFCIFHWRTYKRLKMPYVTSITYLCRACYRFFLFKMDLNWRKSMAGWIFFSNFVGSKIKVFYVKTEQKRT